MITYAAREVVFIIATGLAMLGAISIGAGIILLVTRASSKAVDTIANQTARLAQKGIAEEITGLVGNASALMDALNQLSRTTAGIGFFLILGGFIMLISAYAMVKLY
jgi:hypothetical protein